MMSVQVNLLPDIKKQYLRSLRTKRSIILLALAVSGLFIASVAVLFTTVNIVQKQRISSLSDSIQDDIDELNQVQDLDKILTVQNQLIGLPDLHEDSDVTSRLFNFMSKLTPSNIELDSVALTFGGIDTSQTFDISGTGADFKTVNKFVDILKNTTYQATSTGQEGVTEGAAFDDVVLDSISSTESDDNQNANFTIRLVYAEDIFDARFDKVELQVPSIESSVSSVEKPNLDPFESEEIE